MIKERPHQRLNPTLSNNRLSGREKVRVEKRCRVCGRSGEITRHHLVPHAWFLRRKAELRILRNANANIVPLCVSCHRLVDGTSQPVVRLQKRAALRRALGPNEYAFILQVMGRDWFEHNYPRNP